MMGGRVGFTVISWISALVRSRLAQDRRSTVATMVGLTAIPMVLTAGLALDGTRIWLLQTRLQEAVDASVLLAASSSETAAGTATATTDASNLFWADFGRVSRTTGNASSCSGSVTNVGFMGASICDTALSVTFPDSSHVQVTATATLAMTFMTLVGVSTNSVSASATAQQSASSEIALALDITGSMLDSAGGGLTKEQALQNAVANMLTIIYGSNDTLPNLWFSVVPFRGSINIGTQNQSWLDSTAYGAADWSAQAWRGCVEARQGGYDLTEDPPTTKAFNPLFWASTYHVKPTSSGYHPGDNDWYSGNVTDTGNGSSNTSAWSGLPVGPNLGCSNEAVLPLTASKSTISAKVSGMTAASGGSTVLSQGLQWSWFTLSPLWQQQWSLSPMADGSARPLAYSTPNMSKVIILMTDGDNEWDGNEQTSQDLNCSYNPSVWPECIQTDGYYNSYGRLSANRINMTMPGGSPPTSSNMASQNAATSLDNLTGQICTSIKAKGIIIYTIAFQAAAGSAAETVLKGCATDSAHYFNTNTGNDINNAFATIGMQINSLRLTK